MSDETLNSLHDGWNEVARQHGDKMQWSETGSIKISEARALYDAGLVEMATSRVRLPKKRGRSRSATAELALLIKRRERAEDRISYFGAKQFQQPETVQ